MDIAALSTEMSTVNLNSQVAVSVMKLSMEQMDVSADGMKKIMETSVCPQLGGNIDVSI